MRNLLIIAWLLDSGIVYTLRVFPDTDIGGFMYRLNYLPNQRLPFGVKQEYRSNTLEFGHLLRGKKIKFADIVNKISSSEWENLAWRNGLTIGAWDLI